jgi:hypothetical protein
MPTIGIVNATNVKIFIITAVGPPPTLTAIANATSGTVSVNQSLRTSVNKDDGGWEKSHPAARSWSMAGESEFSFDAPYGASELEATIQARTPLLVRYGTTESGDIHYSGTAYLESFELSGGAEENEMFSYSLKGTGLLKKEAIPGITTEDSNTITATTADISAMVDPNGYETAVVIQYGTTTAYGAEEVCTESPLANGTTAVAVNAQLTGLTAETPYHWRVKATSALGIAYGPDQTFSTIAA